MAVSYYKWNACYISSNIIHCISYGRDPPWSISGRRNETKGWTGDFLFSLFLLFFFSLFFPPKTTKGYRVQGFFCLILIRLDVIIELPLENPLLVISNHLSPSNRFSVRIPII